VRAVGELFRWVVGDPMALPPTTGLVQRVQSVTDRLGLLLALLLGTRSLETVAMHVLDDSSGIECTISIGAFFSFSLQTSTAHQA
jgi:hypothetical protein